jgi:hypothetical protein
VAFGQKKDCASVIHLSRSNSRSDDAAITWTNIEIDGDVLRTECEGRIKTFRIE